jgi:hypothetical protein
LGGIEYAAANEIFSTVHTGTAIFTEEAEGVRVELDRRFHDPRYVALELIGHTGPVQIDYSTLLFAWMRRIIEPPLIVWEIANSISLKQRLIVYDYQLQLAERLAMELQQPPFLIPDSWAFAWGGRRETTLLLNALSVRCLYHLVAVHFGSEVRGLKGGGDANICHVTSREELSFDLALLSSLSKDKIDSFIATLTYGYRSQSPDPALQPIVFVDAKKIAIPCFHFLTSNCERNLLTLQARLESTIFDASSSAFEEMMVRDIQILRERWPNLRTNIEFAAGGQREEFDLLIFDVSEKTILVGELRWMLPPGDPREVQNRKKVCLEKVDQLERKVLWLKRNIDTVLQSLFRDSLDVQKTGWDAFGIAVIDGFGGARSNKPEYPVITKTIFIQGAMLSQSLRALGDWCRSLRWLPQEGRDFSLTSNAFPIGARQLYFPVAEKTATRHEYMQHITDSLSDR